MVEVKDEDEGKYKEVNIHSPIPTKKGGKLNS